MPTPWKGCSSQCQASLWECHGHFPITVWQNRRLGEERGDRCVLAPSVPNPGGCEQDDAIERRIGNFAPKTLLAVLSMESSSRRVGRVWSTAAGAELLSSKADLTPLSSARSHQLFASHQKLLPVNLCSFDVVRSHADPKPPSCPPAPSPGCPSVLLRSPSHVWTPD